MFFQVRNGTVHWSNSSHYVTGIVGFEQFVQQMDPPLPPDQQALAQQLSASVQSYQAANIGPVTLTAGSWFLARPRFLLDEEKRPESVAMWFGLVERIFEHTGPNGDKNLIVQVSTT
jgi:hypothetical protein